MRSVLLSNLYETRYDLRMKVLAYLRCSTTEQATSGLGLAAQRAAIKAEAVRRGWTEIEYVTDEGFSGKNLKRPGIVSALARLKAGDAQILCVSRMDRLSRSLHDFTSLMQQATKEGWALAALDSPADTTTAAGEAMANVMMAFSQMERRLIGERTRAALAVKKAEGITLGRPRVIADDAAQAARTFKADGLSLRKIGAALAEAGYLPPNGTTWHPTTVRALIQRETVAA
jgi:DNA invertase Pin-like site-specific DNA recombinase